MNSIFVEDGMTVGKLKSLLENIPDETPIGVIGYFGEFLQCEEYDWKYHPNGYISEPSPFFQIEAYDLGPEPD